MARHGKTALGIATINEARIVIKSVRWVSVVEVNTKTTLTS